MASTSPFGEHLKRERELRGVSIEEVSTATKISTKFLQAIEHGQWEQLPGGAFNRGFIRSASRYLGLDEDSMVAEYSLETNGNGTSREVPHRNSEFPRDWRPMAVLGAIVLVAIAALIAGGWFAVSKIRARRHAPAPAVASAGAGANVNVSPGVTILAAPASPLRLKVTASKAGSLRVIADGRALFEGQIAAGETKQFGANAAFEISTSDAGSVQLELNGQPMPRMGIPRQPARVTLTAKDLKSSAGGVH
jgi:cytoskeleton protein RodZ